METARVVAHVHRDNAGRLADEHGHDDGILVSRVLMDWVWARTSTERRGRLPDDRWAAVFAAAAPEILALILRRTTNAVAARQLAAMLLHEAVDPNCGRVRLLARVELGKTRHFTVMAASEPRRRQGPIRIYGTAAAHAGGRAPAAVTELDACPSWTSSYVSLTLRGRGVIQL